MRKQEEAWIVTRAKENLNYEILHDFDVSQEKDQNVLEHQEIYLSGVKGSQEHPSMLRRVGYRDEVKQNELVFLTNNRYWAASTIAKIFKE